MHNKRIIFGLSFIKFIVYQVILIYQVIKYQVKAYTVGKCKKLI